MRSTMLRIGFVVACLAIAVPATPSVHAAQSALLDTGPTDAVPAMPDPTWEPPQDEAASYGLGAQELAIGAAIVGGALLIGFAATGSMVSGLTAASAVLILYSVMP